MKKLIYILCCLFIHGLNFSQLLYGSCLDRIK